MQLTDHSIVPDYSILTSSNLLYFMDFLMVNTLEQLVYYRLVIL